MNKNLGRFIFLALLAFWLLYIFMSLPVWAGEVAILKGESAMTFAPVPELAGQLVEIELVSSARYPARYKRLERAVFRNDWRPLLFANSERLNPGKCTIAVLSNGYAVSCLMIYPNKKPPDTLQISVSDDPDRVVGMVVHFSRKLAE